MIIDLVKRGSIGASLVHPECYYSSRLQGAANCKQNLMLFSYSDASARHGLVYGMTIMGHTQNIECVSTEGVNYNVLTVSSVSPHCIMHQITSVGCTA